MTGKEFKSIRKQTLKLNQTDLGLKLGYKMRTVQDWEASEIVPSYAERGIITLLNEVDDGIDTLKLELDYQKSQFKNNPSSTTEQKESRLIPFYDDVISMGGKNELESNTDGIVTPSDYIDAGDWFREATAAIRHYGESMIEYPTGCILALKEVQNRELIIPGIDYMIETSEYRVTKRIQKGNDKTTIIAYSTNPETYVDGRLIHEPFEISMSDIIRISQVLGYVVKKNGGTIVYNNSNK